MIIACAIVIMTTVITLVLMTMTMISILITKAGAREGPTPRADGGVKKGSTVRNNGAVWPCLLALGGPQLISRRLFILVILLCPTYHSPVWQKRLVLESQLNF